MRNLILLILSIFCFNYCNGQKWEYKKVSKDRYLRLFTNEENNLIDSSIIDLKNNNTFTIRKAGSVNYIEMVGTWVLKNNEYIFTNSYPSEKLLSIQIKPFNGTLDGNLPDLVDSNNHILHGFYLDANQNSYSLNDGMIIPYRELDTTGKMRICSNIGNHCSVWFTVPKNYSYRIILNTCVELDKYNGAVKKMVFRKNKNGLILIKSKLSAFIPQ